jgi:hypothetical protein
VLSENDKAYYSENKACILMMTEFLNTLMPIEINKEKVNIKF